MAGISIWEMAEELNVTEETIHRMIRDGRLPRPEGPRGRRKFSTEWPAVNHAIEDAKALRG